MSITKPDFLSNLRQTGWSLVWIPFYLALFMLLPVFPSFTDIKNNRDNTLVVFAIKLFVIGTTFYFCNNGDVLYAWGVLALYFGYIIFIMFGMAKKIIAEKDKEDNKNSV